MIEIQNTTKKICPHCGHTKAFFRKPKICSRCKRENKGWETKKEKHGRIRQRAVK